MSPTSVVRSAVGVAVAANLPVLLWGAPGTGKTSSVLALGAALDLPVEVVVGSIREPSDFSGLPMVRDGRTWFAPPRWAERLSEAGRGLLLLDELTTAPPSVQAAMLRVVLERTVGDLELPAAVRIVAAANPPESAADGWELSAPLANRFVHLDWQVDAIDVAEGLAAGFPVPTTGPLVSPSPAEIGGARSMVAAFLRVRPELLLAVPEEPSRAGRAWPSPRTWEAAATILAACTTGEVAEEVRAELVLGAVGAAAGFELISWLRNLDLPDPETLLSAPDTPLPERADRLYAVLGAVVAHVAADGSPATWEAAWAVVATAARKAPDVAAGAARSLAKARPAGAALPHAMRGLTPILRAAGLLR
ncbi:MULTISPECIES: AAA family ATPase [Actinoalloteichus]|uniref:ATPase family protein associated with various cellular activities (AAA) n=1 Tax=Actinoalloteichus fjordicus TaxID=1612552 RepID=A0AAC9LEC3_9PSEU|nr:MULTISPECIES: MoxR family ATPase [Actinoalloteichus]APU14714.1 ATPase family protein associated with various cellular activities (AAA) [Actinoalloteichus fjordicus]APU20682.1 ATPase family protein associated with various cellular activities (AAA) [Actinoalloteichus sp. GBA129-24]